MKRNRSILAVMMTLLLALALAGCSTLAKPPAPSQGEVPVPPTPSPTPPARTLTQAVFFADWQAMGLIPEEKQVQEAEGAALATEVVKQLLAGPTDPHLHRTIPADVKLVEPVSVQEGVAYVNLSKEFENVRGATGVFVALGSLRLSLTEIPGIEKVQVLVEGKRGVMMDEGLQLVPMDRGFYAEGPVIPDPERVKDLQGRVDQGQDLWRTDAEKVVRWEGRMFGFTQAELEAAQVSVKGNEAVARVSHGDQEYLITLLQNAAGPNGGVWYVQTIDKG